MSHAPNRRQALIGLFAISCAVFMTVMDTLSFASCLLVAGALGDRLGYRRMVCCGLALIMLPFGLGACIGSDLHFLQGFHTVVLVSGLLMLLSALGTLAWCQRSHDVRPTELAELEDCAQLT